MKSRKINVYHISPPNFQIMLSLLNIKYALKMRWPTTARDNLPTCSPKY